MYALGNKHSLGNNCMVMVRKLEYIHLFIMFAADPDTMDCNNAYQSFCSLDQHFRRLLTDPLASASR